MVDEHEEKCEEYFQLSDANVHKLIFDGSGNILDSGNSQNMLEFQASEFSTMIMMDTTKWSWVVCNPVALKLHCNVLRGFVLNTNEFSTKRSARVS